ncbi:LLM class flavin-dependent oxidoreductase [Streptomyces sp. NPDC002143]
MTRPALSVALPPSKDIVDYARAAEQLGYERLWLFDSPALYGDVWMALGRLAEQTDRIKLGTSVAVPSTRHPMVTASAIATVEELSPGRLTVAFGTGFSARRAMGQKPMKWSELATTIRQIRGLLAGEVVEIDGAACQMLHSPGFGPERPVTTPIWAAPSGPKGFAISEELAVDGVVLTMPPEHGEHHLWKSNALLINGTVVQPGEDHTSPRIVEALGPQYGTGFHACWEMFREHLEYMPGAVVWRDAMLAARPEHEQHLAIHEGHLCYTTERDRAGVEAAGPALLSFGWTGDAASIGVRLDETGAAGIAEVILNPSGDIIDELGAFAAAASNAG